MTRPAPGCPVVRHARIHGARDEYCAWPSIARSPDGTLTLVFCRSEEHLGPTGSILCLRSRDGGMSWTPPATARDSPLDDRESGLTTLRDGRMVLHVYSARHTADWYRGLPPLSYEPGVLDRWIRRVEREDYRGAASWEGGWAMLSGDGGGSWSDPLPGPDTVHGGIELSSGGLIAASYRGERGAIGLWETPSRDPLAWRKAGTFSPPRVAGTHFGEPHLVELTSGRVLMMIRATAEPYDDRNERNVLWLTWSDDAGRSWAEARPTPLWGFPPHLVKLSDGRILGTYGYRRPPYGERACVSEDGLTWDPNLEVVLRSDADNGDLGYPASVELEPGKILTVYYQAPSEQPPPRMRPPDPQRAKPCIWGTHWELRDR